MRADLLDWGFNTVGWVQEYVAINAQHHRHSRSFTPEEYRSLNMPYGHLLPFIESHQWEIETRLPKIDSPGFAEWCDYVARDQCVRFRNGYGYTPDQTTHGAERCSTPGNWPQRRAALSYRAWRRTTTTRSIRPSAATIRTI
ncbi:MAG: hypothetical protein FJW31_30650 [Acidobacteria bacterium]|nr:hypothetical protein [Acidobacteriota bacterium]